MDLALLKKDLIEQEGMKLRPYLCPAGKVTIGVGRNLEDIGITEQEALTLLDHDIQRVLVQCQKTFDWWFTLNGPRKLVLLNMVFNMGIQRVFEFQRMMAALERRDFQSAANEMLNSKWASQVKKRAVYLSQMMRTGEYPDS